MTTQSMQTTATISNDLIFFSPPDEIEKPETSQTSWQNTEVSPEFGTTEGIKIKNISFPLGRGEQLETSQPSEHGKSALPELRFEEEVLDLQQQHFMFPTYREYFIFPTYTEQVSEIIDLVDDDVLDIMRSRAVEQEVLDLLDEPISR